MKFNCYHGKDANNENIKCLLNDTKVYKINDEHNIISETKIQKINRKLINNENKNMVTVNRILT